MNVKLKNFRVYITERCNAKCPSCFNALSRTSSEIPVEKISELSDYLAKNGIKKLKIMGGEPTIHENFIKIIEIAQMKFDSICIFTNGLDNNLYNLRMRPDDSIVYNFNFYKTLDAEKLLLVQPGKRNLEVQVHNNTDEKKLAENILQVVNFDKQRIAVALTLDCTSNIFKDRKILLEKLYYIEDCLLKNNVRFSYDHKMPLCFSYGTHLNIKNKGTCNLSELVDVGLIDSDFNLRFCNQHSQKIIPIYKNGRFIPWQILINHLIKTYYELQVKALDELCLDCVFYNVHCNGGCWLPGDKICRNDILRNTEFPTKNKE